MGKSLLAGPIAGLLLALAAAPACAQSLAGATQCRLAAAPLAFGRYSPTQLAPSDSTLTVMVTCLSASATPVPVHATLVLEATPPVRQLRAGPHALRYQLYVDAARTMPWGDGSGGTATFAVTGLVSRASPLHKGVTVFGRVLARQKTAAVGSYTDQLLSALYY